MIKTKGGYAMVDLAHVSLSGLGVTFAGLYQKLYSKLGKPILLCNICIGETEYQDCYVQPVYTAEGFEMTVGDYTITVSSNSVVTATEGIVGGGAGGASELSQLIDVSIDDESLQDGDVLSYDATLEDWVNRQPTTGPDELSELTDVDLTTPQDGDVLTYSNGEWVNGQPSGGSGDLTEAGIYFESSPDYQGGLPSQGNKVSITGNNIAYIDLGDDVDNLVGKTLVALKSRVGVATGQASTSLLLLGACAVDVDYDEYNDTYFVYAQGLYGNDTDVGAFTQLYLVTWSMTLDSQKELDKSNSTLDIVRIV